MNGLKCPSRKATAREQDEVTKGKTHRAAGSPRRGAARTQRGRVGACCSRGGSLAGPCLRGGSPPTMCTQRKPINHTRRTVPTGNARTRLEPRERPAAAPRTGQRAAGRCKPRPRHAGPGSRPWPGGATSLEQHRLYPTPEDTKGLFQNPGRRDGDAGRPPTASSLVSGPCPGHGCRRGGETRQRLPDPSAHRTVLSLVRFVPPGPGF